MKAIAELGIKPIDLVVVNLYPFEEVTAERGVSEADAIENIDIGGPCMVRAAAKNFAGVGIVTDPADYDLVLAELKENAGDLTRDTRRHLAAKAFHHTAHYDSAIATWFGEQEEDFPANLMLDLVKLKDLRYGENPHQRAAWYSEVRPRESWRRRSSSITGSSYRSTTCSTSTRPGGCWRSSPCRAA